jgi:hypothetical protein
MKTDGGADDRRGAGDRRVVVAPEDVLGGGDVVDAVLELERRHGLAVAELEDPPGEERRVVAVAQCEECEDDGGKKDGVHGAPDPTS